MKYLYIDQPNR